MTVLWCFYEDKVYGLYFRESRGMKRRQVRGAGGYDNFSQSNYLLSPALITSHDAPTCCESCGVFLLKGNILLLRTCRVSNVNTAAQIYNQDRFCLFFSWTDVSGHVEDLKVTMFSCIIGAQFCLAAQWCTQWACAVKYHCSVISKLTMVSSILNVVFLFYFLSWYNLNILLQVD